MCLRLKYYRLLPKIMEISLLKYRLCFEHPSKAIKQKNFIIPPMELQTHFYWLKQIKIEYLEHLLLAHGIRILCINMKQMKKV